MLRRVTAAIASPCRVTSSSIGTRSYSSQLEDERLLNSWERFLQGGLAGASNARVQQQQGGKSRVRVSWEDGHESEFSAKWLRDHSADAFNPHTKQREVGAPPKRKELAVETDPRSRMLFCGDAQMCSLVWLPSFSYARAARALHCFKQGLNVAYCRTYCT